MKFAKGLGITGIVLATALSSGCGDSVERKIKNIDTKNFEFSYNTDNPHHEETVILKKEGKKRTLIVNDATGSYTLVDLNNDNIIGNSKGEYFLGNMGGLEVKYDSNGFKTRIIEDSRLSRSIQRDIENGEITPDDICLGFSKKVEEATRLYVESEKARILSEAEE